MKKFITYDDSGKIISFTETNDPTLIINHDHVLDITTHEYVQDIFNDRTQFIVNNDTIEKISVDK